jgi:menaquinone-dependent protoporphyrinogen oxidase
MGTIILFDSKYGTTADIASRLAENLGDDVRLVYLRDRGALSASLEGIDLVVIGASVYAGSWSKRAAAFARKRQAELADRKFAYFTVGLDLESEGNRASAALPPALVASAVGAGRFGGAILWSKMNPFERFIIKAIRKTEGDYSLVDLAAVDGFAKKISQAAGA